MQYCSTCEVVLHEGNSYTRKKGPRAGTFVGTCHDCNRKAYQDWRKNNPLRARARGMRNRYGIELSDFLQALRKQENRCAICKKEFARTPQIDHKHSAASFKLRGLLCGLCNRGLGCFQDSPQLLKAAIQYLAGAE